MSLNRTESFVPLTTATLPSSGDRTEFKATVMSEPAQVQKFQSVAAFTATATAAPRAGNCEPRVTVQRDGNRVTGMLIQCSCGEVINLACVYEAVAPQAAAEPAPVIAEESAAEPSPATTPQSAAAKAAPGKKGKETGKVLPAAAAKKAKTPEKGRGTSAAKRRSA